MHVYTPSRDWELRCPLEGPSRRGTAEEVPHLVVPKVDDKHAGEHDFEVRTKDDATTDDGGNECMPKPLSIKLVNQLD